MIYSNLLWLPLRRLNEWISISIDDSLILTVDIFSFSYGRTFCERIFLFYFFFLQIRVISAENKQTNKPKQCQLIIGSNCEHGEWYSTAIEKGKKNDLIEVELVFFSIIRDEWTHCGRYCLINSRFLPYSYVLPCSSHAKWLPSGSIWTLSSKCHVNVCLFNSNSMVVGQF